MSELHKWTLSCKNSIKTVNEVKIYICSKGTKPLGGGGYKVKQHNDTL